MKQHGLAMLKACLQPGVTPISIQAQLDHNRMKLHKPYDFSFD
ncbi:hypothetical protein HDE69_001001 [Pedobacter cryoconitis]|uniref:Uncharacterized protein n=1 Tax=Pedobacter cryoconitis TaxID=188932 RepID=A0A7W8YQY8_9SPHI|nr:hypothetical protein [Pedobacter cryoconitis]MBB5619963.1 hypothetical protein [Pedobacter cryoconitis]